MKVNDKVILVKEPLGKIPNPNSLLILEINDNLYRIGNKSMRGSIWLTKDFIKWNKNS